MRSFNAALGRRCVGAYPIDVELVKRPSELRMALAGRRLLLIDPEHARFVAVECQWLPVALEIFMSRLKIRKC